MLLIETAFFQVNTVPYGTDNEDLYLSPNDILVLFFQMDSLASTSSRLHNVNLRINKLKVYRTDIQLVMEQAFLKDWRRYALVVYEFTNPRKMYVLKRGT